MRNVSDKICRENQNTNFTFNNFIIFFRKSFRLRENVEKCCTAGQATDDNRRMPIACWKIKATSTHSGYVIIIAFSRQRWSRQRASVLRDMCSTLSVQFQLQQVRSRIH